MTDYLAFPPVRGVKGTVAAPPSKSATNRALVLAALGSDPVQILRPLDSEDTRALVTCLSSMGAEFTPSGRTLTVRGPLGTSGGSEIVLDAGASGTAARFLAALAAAVPGRYRLTGSARLRERPMAELVAALRSGGASIEPGGRDGFLPLVITGKTLRSGEIAVDASRSSQFVSALLLAAVAIEGGLSVERLGPVVSAPYVETTLETLAAFGHRVRREAGRIAVERGESAPQSFAVPGDWSSALPFLAAAGIAGGEVVVTGLPWPSSDADARAADVMEAMGVALERTTGSIHATGDPRALRPASIDARDFPDAVPVLSALAAHADGPSRFRGVAHLRIKESDRIAALVALLDAAGASGSAGEDELLVGNGTLRRSAGAAPRLPTFEDHRMAMAAALLSLSSSGTLIENPRCVAKSYPAFFRDLETILVRG